MALKTNFKDSNVISSPFVDEVANTDHTAVARVRTTINKVLQEAKTDAEISRRADAKSAPRKPKPKAFTGGDQRNVGQKILDREANRREALKAAQGR